MLPYIRKDFFVCPNPIYMDIYSKCEYDCLYCFTKVSEQTYRKHQCSKPIHPVVPADFERRLQHLLDHKDHPVTRLIKRGVPVILSGKCEPFCPYELTHGYTAKTCMTLRRYGINIAFETKGIVDPAMSSFLLDLDPAINITIIPGTDDQCRLMEPGTPVYSVRFKWAKELTECGLWVGVKAEPLIPTWNTDKETIDAWVDACAKANVKHVNFHDFRVSTSDATILSKRLSTIGVDLTKVLREFVSKGTQISEYTFNALKERGLKVSSPDWIHFGDRNTCNSCCGLDQKFSYQPYTYFTALRLLKEKGQVTLDDLDPYNYMDIYKRYELEKVWDNPMMFRLSDIPGIFSNGKDSKGFTIYTTKSKLSPFEVWSK